MKLGPENYLFWKVNDYKCKFQLPVGLLGWKGFLGLAQLRGNYRELNIVFVSRGKTLAADPAGSKRPCRFFFPRDARTSNFHT